MYTTTKSKIYPTSLNPKDWEMSLTNNSVKSAVSVPSAMRAMQVETAKTTRRRQQKRNQNANRPETESTKLLVHMFRLFVFVLFCFVCLFMSLETQKRNKPFPTRG